MDVFLFGRDGGFTAEEVNKLCCDLARQLGDPTEDEYDGEDGLHGNASLFSVDADGVAVLVFSTMSAEQAHEVAEELGGEDESGTSACTDSSPGRIAV